MDVYTDAQATDEAVLRLTRKLRRKYPEVYAATVGTLSAELQDALNQSDIRADRLRTFDSREGITRTLVDRYAYLDSETEKNGS